ncbi:phosphatidylethanolamine-binding protein [Flammula alnicola]|nr:phosphatidylethanolamine-binding protein [Flammula alnicola]
MFAIRRLPTATPRYLTLVVRGNATVASSPSATEPAQPPPPSVKPTKSTSATTAAAPSEQSTTQGRRRRKQPPKRPSISSESPRKWNRPLSVGVVPAYDLALGVLKKDSLKLKEEVKEFRKLVEGKEATYKALEAKLQKLHEGDAGLEATTQEMEALNEELESLLNKLNILEVQSEINLPDVRWTVNNAMADMSNMSHRYLVEQKWRKEGDLDLLMERIYQMNVVPDVLPVIKPSVDLHVVVRTRPSEFIETKKVQTLVEPGVFLRPKQTLVPPKLHANVFHTDTRLYTMLLVDPDVPDPETERFTTFLHWMKPNIPLSATSPLITNINTHTKYIPPHPQHGTPYHRYVCLLLPQPPLGASGYTLTAASRAAVGVPTSAHLDIPVVPTEERLGFNVRAFVERWNLDAAQGGGAHMFREIWDEDVSEIYKSVLKTPEPRYGRPRRVDVYAQLKEKKKYIS